MLLIVLVPRAQSAAISIAMPARMSGALHGRAAELGGSGDERPVRIAEYDPCAHPGEFVDEEHPRLEHLLVHQDDAFALRRGDDGDGHQVGGERRPRLVLELRHSAAEVGTDPHLLLLRHEQVIAVDRGAHAQAVEAHPDRTQVCHAGVGDSQGRMSHRGEADERADLDVVRTDAMRAAVECAAPVHGEDVRTDPLDPRPHGDEHPTEVLHMRFARGVMKDRRAARRDGGHHRVLGASDARFIEEDVSTHQPGRAEGDAIGEDVLGAHRLQREEVRVQPPSTDHVTAGRRQRDRPGAREERRGEEDRGADAHAELWIEAVPAHRGGGDHERTGGGPLGGRTRLPDQLDQALDVADARHVLERDRLVGEERGAEDRERGVLIPGGPDRAAQLAAAFNDELGR